MSMKSFSNQKLKSNPATNKSLIRRKRLEQKIQANLDKKLILVISHAGSGKTTLISSLIESLRVDHIWYSLDNSDQEIASFIYYLASQLQHNYPTVFKGFERKFISSGSHIEPPALLASRFANEFGQCLSSDKRFIIVLDNYEVVNKSVIINQFLDHAVKSLPRCVTIILCSTQVPNMRLSKLALNDELYQINGTDLAFNLDEIGDLFSNTSQLQVSREELERICEKTEGWVTGLILLVQFLKTRGSQTIEDLLESVNGYGKTISKYLMENVFESQPKHIQKFLCKTALLSYLSPDICNPALDVKYSGRLLENLVDNNIFTFYLDSKNFLYRYHPLMKEFLLKKLYEDFSQAEIEEIQAHLGEILTPIDPENAINHLVSAKRFSKAVNILRSVGQKMLHESRFNGLDNLLKSIPSSFIDEDPTLLYISGRIAEIHGEADRAFECYKKASSFFERQEESINKIACPNRLAVINIRQDKYQGAKDFLQKNIVWLESQNMKKDVAHKLIIGYTNLSEVLIKLEEREKSEAYLQKAKILYDSYPEPYYHVALEQCQALKSIVEGDLWKGIEIAKQGESLAQQLRLTTKLQIFYHYLSFGYLHLGHFSESLYYASKGLEIAKQFGIENNITGGLFADFGQVQYALSNHSQAVKNLEKSLTLFQKGQNLCGGFWSNHALYHISLKIGDLEGAQRYLHDLLHLANKMRFPLEVGMSRINLAYYFSLKKEEKKMLKLIEIGQQHFKDSIKRMSLFLAHLIISKAYINLGDEKRAETHLCDSLKFLQGPNLYLYEIHQERNWIFTFLQRLISRVPQCRKMLTEYENVVHRSFDSAKGDGETLQYSVEKEKENEELANLRIYSLGPFRMFVGDKEITLSKCKSKKAITLLKYLFFSRNKGSVSKDVLLDLLWPDATPKQADLNFRVTLSLLRKTISIASNGRKNIPNLLRTQQGYQLSLGREGWSDVDEFNNEMNLGGYKEKKQDHYESLRHYLNAENLYKDDFLVENLYEDWCFIEREHLKNQYLYALTKILDYYEGQRNLTEAINYCYKILKADPYRENIFRRLMQYHYELGNRKEVKSVFELCKNNIENKLGVALSYETKEIYHKLSLSS